MSHGKKKANRHPATVRATRVRQGVPMSDAKRDGMCAAKRGYNRGISR